MIHQLTWTELEIARLLLQIALSIIKEEQEKNAISRQDKQSNDTDKELPA